MRNTKAAIAIIGLILFLTTALFSQPSPTRWYKGNTHTHTKNSDGDSPPADVVKWYSDNKYNFLFMTDHEFITPVAPLNEQFGKAGEFLVLHGQEVTGSFDKKPLHTNGLGIDRVSMPKRGANSVETLQMNIDAIRALGGVPQLNHPNFGWALTAAEISQLKNVNLMEIYNGHPYVNNIGGGGSPGAEAIWDSLLTSGMRIYGIADDDSHYFKRLGDRSAPTPGQAWIMVRAPELTPLAILTAIDNGDFYGTTGVEFVDIKMDRNTLTVEIRPQGSSKFTVQFIGRHGKLLATSTSTVATYSLRGSDPYVRAKVIESNGKIAWTQPLFRKR